VHLAELLARQARACDPDRVVVFDGTTPWASHAQWAARAAGLALRLRGAGLKPGERVLLFMHNHPRYLELLWGLWWAGLVAVPVNAKLHPSEVAWIATDAGARRAFVSADLVPEPLPGLAHACAVDSPEADALLAPVDDLAAHPPAEAAPDDLAWLFYTSGTTGRPKGVMLTQRNLMTMGLTYAIDVDPLDRGDTMAYAAPMSHGCGLYAIPHLMAGARHVVPASRGVEPAELFALGRALGPLSTFAAPTIVRRLVDHAQAAGLGPADAAASFKTIVYGGAPMYAADIRRALAVMGPRFVQIYGQGETPMTATALSRRQLGDGLHPRHAERLASVGLAQTPVRVRVAAPDGRPLPAGETGEVLVRGDTVMAGYWRNPAATAAALRDGWLWTGDLGALDADGFLTLKDRSKDLVISGGSNIYPREVEEVLLTAAGVSEVAVVGAPDAEWGEVVVAFVVMQPGVPADAAALDAHCLAHIARFKRPRRYVFTDALPKNHYGKVLKTALRLQAAGAAGASAGPPAPS
jgi:long-chain acyl-CoA synthetase